jgi:hypothetical protein
MFHVKHQPLISPLLDDCALWLRPDYREIARSGCPDYRETVPRETKILQIRHTGLA